ncbi:hypothetical protein BKA93DRAFT_21842 [Sparassis latifolia]
MPRRQAVQGPSQTFTFWGMVGVVMAALKLKEHMDDYRRVPSEEEGLGPLALHSPVLDANNIGASGDGFLDTEIPGARPKRSKRNCCVCCGMRCGLFWKAFGIVCLLFLGWQAIKLAIWAVTPKPTGLEGMPEFSTSLGCSNAPYIYNATDTTFLVPVGLNNADHEIEILGKAVGTLTFVQGDSDATDVKYDITLRADQDGLFDSILLQHSTAYEIEHGISNSHTRLATTYESSACMRYDIKVSVPPTLKNLAVSTRTVTHIKFDTDSMFDFDKLSVSMRAMMETGHLLLPHTGVHAGMLLFDISRGWLVGDVAIVDKTTLSTSKGDAVMNVHVHPVPSTADLPATAELQTTTGTGRTDVFFVSSAGHVHRPISSTHSSLRGGEMYLTYKEAEFKGEVDLSAKSYSASGLQGSMMRHGGMGGELPWVGDKNGGDKIVAQSPNGWIGLYF